MHDLSGLPDPERDHQFYAAVAMKRLIAGVIDVAIVLVAALLISAATLGVGLFIFPLVFMISNVAYRVYTVRKNSCTWGMGFVGIEIRNGQGNRLEPTEVVWHSTLYCVIFMILPAQIISMTMMGFTARGQGLHDMFLGTTAINKPVD